MNLLNHYVEKVLSERIETPYGWKVEVEVDCWGRTDKTYVMLPMKEEPQAVGVAYTYLA